MIDYLTYVIVVLIRNGKKITKCNAHQVIPKLAKDAADAIKHEMTVDECDFIEGIVKSYETC